MSYNAERCTPLFVVPRPIVPAGEFGPSEKGLAAHLCLRSLMVSLILLVLCHREKRLSIQGLVVTSMGPRTPIRWIALKTFYALYVPENVWVLNQPVGLGVRLTRSFENFVMEAVVCDQWVTLATSFLQSASFMFDANTVSKWPMCFVLNCYLL